MTRAQVFVSAGYKAIVALMEIGECTNYKRDAWPRHRPTGKCPPYRFEATGPNPIQQFVQTKWDIAVYGIDLYLLGPSNNFLRLTRVEKFVITRPLLAIIRPPCPVLYQGPPTACHHWSQTLTIDHLLQECAVLQEYRDEYYTVDSLNTLFATMLETCMVEFLWEAGFVWYERSDILYNSSLESPDLT